MNNDQHYCLRWNNFQTNVVSELESFWNDENFVDVTLSCGAKQIKAHKLILSASSPYFKQIFQDNPCKHPIVMLQDVDPNILKLILEYVYTGAVNVSEKLMPSLLRTADMLHIRGLTETSSTSVPMSTSSVENIKREVPDCEQEVMPPVKKMSRKSTLLDEPRINHFEELKNVVEGTSETCSRKSQLFNPEILSNNHVESQSSSMEFQGNTDSLEGAANIFNFPGEVIADVTIKSGPEGSRSHSLDPRPCPVCGHVYSNLSNLRQHIRLIHNPECVTCPLCSKTFKNKLYLKRHLISFHELAPPSQDQDRAKAAMYSNLLNNAALSSDQNSNPVDPRSYSHVMSTQGISPRRRHDEINSMLFGHQKNLINPQKSTFFDQSLDDKLETPMDTNSNCYNEFHPYGAVLDKSIMNNNHDTLSSHNKQSVLAQGKHQYLQSPVTSSNSPSNPVQN
ncbi:unnamed protein product [Bemisia tabaci]|uniref:Uncharacterized protein n=1 Tax=Bemisia tabaci TaxID=7038 RepID=A0A9P0AMJ8_BEMTA|nr:unnamed protein product [Bemisia tabaci]